MKTIYHAQKTLILASFFCVVFAFFFTGTAHAQACLEYEVQYISNEECTSFLSGPPPGYTTCSVGTSVGDIIPGGAQNCFIGSACFFAPPSINFRDIAHGTCSVWAPPTVTLTHTPSNPIPYNSAATLTWSSTNADSCTATAGAGFSTGGADSGSDTSSNLTSNTTFSISCTGPGGTVTASRSVTVAAPPNAPPVANAGGNRTITLPTNSTTDNGSSGSDPDGDPITFSWSKVGGPAGGTISNGNTTNPTFSGLNNTGTYTFRLTVTDDSGATDTDDMTVTVNPAPAPTVTLTHTPSNPIPYNSAATLTWSSTNADSCTATGGAGFSTGGSDSGSDASSNLTSNTTFSISCTGPGGTVTANRSVTVAAASAPDVNISLADYDIPQNGNAVVTWTVTGSADTCTASGDYSGWDTFNPSTSGGTQSFGPINLPNMYEFSIECSNAFGSSALKTVYLKVGPILDPPACPLTPQAGRQIINWSPNSPVLYANQPASKAVSKQRSVTLVDGQDYEVTVVAYDGYTGRTVDTAQTGESIFIRFRNGGTNVYETGATSDIPDGVEEATVNEVVDTFTMSGTANNAVAVNASYWDADPHSVRPVCAAIDEVTVAAPAISIVPHTLNFGNVEVGETATRTFMVSNTGGGNLVVNIPTISSTHVDVGPGVFECAQGGCNAVQSITNGSPMTYTVTYTPTAVSNGQTATLNFTGTIPSNVSLEGNGIAPPPPPPAYCWEQTGDTFVATDGQCTALGPRDGMSAPASSACDEVSEVGNVYRQGCSGGGPGFYPIFTCSNTCTPPGPPIPNAYFTNTNMTPTITDGDTVALEWDSDDADPGSCEITSSGTDFFTGLSTSGTEFVTPSSNISYSIECSNSTGVSPNSPDVVVTVNPALNCSMVANKTVTGGTGTIGPYIDGWNAEATLQGVAGWVNICQSWCNTNGAAYCDLDFEQDWDPTNIPGSVNGSITCTGYTAGSLNVQSNQIVPVAPNRHEAYQYYASDCGGVTPPSPPPTVDLEIRIDGGAWQTTDPVSPVNLNETVELRWSSDYASLCTGTNFVTNNLTDGTATSGSGDVTVPAPASFLTYTLNCDGEEEDIRIEMSAAPNLQIGFNPDPVLTEQTDVDGYFTGNYSAVQLQVFISEVNGVAVTSDFDVEIDFDVDSDGVDETRTYTVSAADMADSAHSITDTFNSLVSFNPASQAVARVDVPLASNGVIAETVENDNTATLSPIPSNLPPPDMDLELDPSDLVRGGGNVEIDYDTNAVYDMLCELSGPGLATHSFNPMSDGATPASPLVAGPINSKSVYTLRCVEQITGTSQVFTETASVETTGQVEEI